MELFTILCFCGLVAWSSGNQCKNEQNQDIDWFYVYKFPKNKESVDVNVQNGVGYAFLTSNNPKDWTISSISINSSKSMVGLTLDPFYKDRENLAFVLYNDQPPNSPSKESKGHTKGAILATSNSSLWLIHSVPHFIALGSVFRYPSTGVKNGQSFLCLSLNLNSLNEVGKQLQYNEPQIYAFNIPNILKTKMTEVSKVVSGITVNQPPWFRKTGIVTKNGDEFVSFAKSRKFGKDLYEDFVANEIKTDLYVETWRDGSGKMASNCSGKFKIFNVETITLNSMQENESFESTKDHSKWAVAANTDSNWVCIGDINRMDHQMDRGGGTVCFNNNHIKNNYRNCVRKIEECSNLI